MRVEFRRPNGATRYRGDSSAQCFLSRTFRRRALTGIVIGIAVASCGVAVATSSAAKPPAPFHAPNPSAAVSTGFDLQGHRGTRGLRPEDTLPAFAKALDIGVRTLELDTGVSKDGVVVVSHDSFINPLVCTDTAPADAGDPAFPYVGKYFTI
jgi:glycerophosphoryl diester phosphodiesterase